MAVPTARGIMTAKAVSVQPENSVFEAHRLLAENNFHGLPVVDKNNKLVGILTEYDLLVNGMALHLPAFEKILAELQFAETDRERFKTATAEISRLTVGDIMNKEPLTFDESTSFQDMVRIFCEHHRVNPIPVIDKDHRLVGVISRHDVLKLFVPSPAEIPSAAKTQIVQSQKNADLDALTKTNMEKLRNPDK